MIYELKINGSVTETSNQFNKLMQFAYDCEAEPLRFKTNDHYAKATSVEDTIYLIIKKTVNEIFLDLELPNINNCEDCEHFAVTSDAYDTGDSPADEDCTLSDVVDCPVLIEACK